MDPIQDEPIQITIYEPSTADPEKLSPRKLTLRVDIPCMLRLRENYDPPIDIRRLLDADADRGGLVGQMQHDPSIAIDIAYEATRHIPGAPQDKVAFATGLGGDALGEITDAVLKAVVSFTPDPKNRSAYQAILSKAETIFGSIRSDALGKLESGEMDEELRKEIEDALGVNRDSARPESTVES
jgi:hypothetical protein